MCSVPYPVPKGNQETSVSKAILRRRERAARLLAPPTCLPPQQASVESADAPRALHLPSAESFGLRQGIAMTITEGC